MVHSHSERARFSRQKADRFGAKAERIFNFVLSTIAVGVTLIWAVSIVYGISVIVGYLL